MCAINVQHLAIFNIRKDLKKLDTILIKTHTLHYRSIQAGRTNLNSCTCIVDGRYNKDKAWVKKLIITILLDDRSA